MVYEVIVNGQPHRLELEKASSGWECRLDGRSIPIDAVMTRRDVISLLIGGHSYEIKCAVDEKGPRKILAPMPGRIVRLLVTENSEVGAGQGILVVEAMKMQNEIKSPRKGVVKKLSATTGASVNPGDILAIVE